MFFIFSPHKGNFPPKLHFFEKNLLAVIGGFMNQSGLIQLLTELPGNISTTICSVTIYTQSYSISPMQSQNQTLKVWELSAQTIFPQFQGGMISHNIYK